MTHPPFCLVNLGDTSLIGYLRAEYVDDEEVPEDSDDAHEADVDAQAVEHAVW